MTLTRMMMYGVDLYRRLAAETGVDPSWREVGSLRLASTTARYEELQRQAGWAKTFGLPLDLITAREAQERFPLMTTDGVLGAVWLPTDGWLDPSNLALALAAGARKRGARILQHHRVVGIGVRDGRVTGVDVEHGGERHHDRGRRRRQRRRHVRAGDRAARRRQRADHPDGAPVPAHGPRSRASFPGLPQLRDPDNLVYFREEVGGLCMGGYERNPAPWSLDGIPADFNHRLLDPDWPRFEEIMDGAIRARARRSRTRASPG